MSDICRAALRNLFIADTLGMPVHWFYSTEDIRRAFPPAGITEPTACPSRHPSSIMSLHSTQRGGRSRVAPSSGREVVGDVILKGRRQFWSQPNVHYHHGMQRGDSTLNAHCARVAMRTAASAEGYSPDRFAAEYIAFMTADPPLHNDTYAESYHRGFFANYVAGQPPMECAAVTHDTPSIGGLVTVAPVALALLLKGQRDGMDRNATVQQTQQTCRTHVALTHPDDTLAAVCDSYVALMAALLFAPRGPSGRVDKDVAVAALSAAAARPLGVDLSRVINSATRAGGCSDESVCGRLFSTACYITDSWPSLLFFAARHGVDDSATAMLANVNCGGDCVHRGAVLGVLLGLIHGRSVEWWPVVSNAQAIDAEISALFD